MTTITPTMATGSYTTRRDSPKYPEEFRREAVELYRSSDRSRAEVASSLGISDGSLAAWVKDYDRDRQPGALDPVNGPSLLGSARRTPSCARTARSCGKQLRISPGRRSGELLPVRRIPVHHLSGEAAL
jgi:transposase-like protein